MKRPRVERCGNAVDFDSLSAHDQEEIKLFEAYVRRLKENGGTTEQEKSAALVKAYEDTYGVKP